MSSGLKLCIGAIALFATSGMALAERLTSRVLEYLVVQEDHSRHETVQRIILNSVKSMRDRMTVNGTQNMGYLVEVGTYPNAGQPVTSLAEIEALWDDATEPALQVLYGEMVPENDDSYLIKSTVFIGNLPALAGASLPDNSFEIESSTKVSDYGRLANGHAYMLTYALILQAIETAKPTDVVLALINEADTLFEDMSRAGLVSPEVTRIHAAVVDLAVRYDP